MTDYMPCSRTLVMFLTWEPYIDLLCRIHHCCLLGCREGWPSRCLSKHSEGCWLLWDAHGLTAQNTWTMDRHCAQVHQNKYTALLFAIGIVLWINKKSSHWLGCRLSYVGRSEWLVAYSTTSALFLRFTYTLRRLHGTPACCFQKVSRRLAFTMLIEREGGFFFRQENSWLVPAQCTPWLRLWLVKIF
jgi:hypothetical protein